MPGHTTNTKSINHTPPLDTWPPLPANPPREPLQHVPCEGRSLGARICLCFKVTYEVAPAHHHPLSPLPALSLHSPLNIMAAEAPMAPKNGEYTGLPDILTLLRSFSRKNSCRRGGEAQLWGKWHWDWRGRVSRALIGSPFRCRADPVLPLVHYRNHSSVSTNQR